MIGGALPQAPRSGSAAPGAGDQNFGWGLPQRPGGDDDRTVIGGALPPMPAQNPSAWPSAPQPAPHSPPPPWQGGGQGLGGLGAAPSPSPPGSFGLGLGTGLGGQGQQGFFPQLEPAYQGQAPAAAPLPRIPLQQALKATGLAQGGSANPLLAAATNLLILFGRLRSGIVEMNAVPLMEHVTREIEGYEARAIAGGAPPQEALVAKYLLCGTADDIVQNLPGADRGLWEQYSMAARFFNTRDTGVGFFREAEKAIQSPAQYSNLLELMQVCLSLGFEGQYRTVQGGSAQLARIRSALYEAVRRVRPRPDDDLSYSWQPVMLGGKRRFGQIPVWVIGGLCAAALVAFFATLSTLINRQSAVAAHELYTLHPTDQKIALNGQMPSVPYVSEAAVTQLNRIRTAMQPEIEQQLVSVDEIGDFISIRVGNLLLFDSGQAKVKEDFAPLAARIAEVVNAEQGPVLVEGHTDAQQPSGRGKYKTNLDLSLARATAVGEVLTPLLTDAARLKVEGRGEAQPIADNAEEAGRAQNRRVEIMIAKEGTFEAP